MSFPPRPPMMPPMGNIPPPSMMSYPPPFGAPPPMGMHPMGMIRHKKPVILPHCRSIKDRKMRRLETIAIDIDMTTILALSYLYLISN